MTLKILKFGGSSVGSAEALRRAAAIVREELPAGGLVVVSALRGTTDRILDACAAAGAGRVPEAQAHLAGLRNRHRETAGDLGLLDTVTTEWDPLFDRLDQLLTGSSTVSIAFLIPEARLGDLIPRLHDRCVLDTLQAQP